MADKVEETVMDVTEETSENDPKASATSVVETMEEEDEATEEDVMDAGGDANGGKRSMML